MASALQPTAPARTSRVKPRATQTPAGFNERLRHRACSEDREREIVVDHGGRQLPGFLVDRRAPAPPVLAALEDQAAVELRCAKRRAAIRARSEHLGSDVDTQERRRAG